MNQDLQSGGFEQFDADAVCEQCGSVNDEGTLLCKVCGQNLRDQRTQRLANAQGVDVFEDKISRVRLLTGLLSVLGLLVVVLAALNISNIEAGLVSFLTADGRLEGDDLWSGTNNEIFDGLLRELEEYPSSETKMADALENPLDDRSYNGRYVLVRPGRLDVNRIIGEANLSRRADRFYFVVLLKRGSMDIRGYAEVEQEGEESRAISESTTAIVIETAEYTGFGFADKLFAGGHRVFAASDYNESDTFLEVLAYRVR